MPEGFKTEFDKKVGAINNRGCAREFHAPVSLLGGRTRSLRDATYITGISKKESAPPQPDPRAPPE
jgi:hypothetical protein